MLEKVCAYDAKTKLPEILRRVESGESFTITNRGKPVADLISSQFQEATKVQLAIDNRLNAKKHHVSDDLKGFNEQGRK